MAVTNFQLNNHVMKTKLFLCVMAFIGIAFTSQAQSLTEKHTEMYSDRSLLQGEWVLENVSLLRAHQSVNAEDYNIDIVSKIGFKQNSIFLTSGEQTFEGTYTFDEKFLNFDFPVVPFNSATVVIDDVLYLQQIVNLPHNEEDIQVFTEACDDDEVFFIIVDYAFKRKQ